MFEGKKFITKGVSENIPPPLQFLLWELIHNIPVDKDYLQVFCLSVDNGRQRIKHTQEVPEYSNEYVLDIDKPITAKIFVIDDETHSTMLMNYEY